MHLSTVKIPIDFGLDKPSISFLIVKANFFTLHLYCFCITFSETIVNINETITGYQLNQSPFLTKLMFCCQSSLNISIDNYTPRFNEVERGVYWYHLVHLSVCLSVRLSVCGQNRVRSVSSTILIGSISYVHILSSNFRRCVACKACFEIQKFEILAIFLNL